MSIVPALVAFAVIPFGEEPLYYIADINVGLLFIVSVTSIGVYGIILGGWASNSKYPLLASLCASAQLISYEIAITMTLVSIILTAGTLRMVGIGEAQRDAAVWFGFIQPVAFVLVFIGGLAETNRLPFDLPEAETELTGGFHTEYSGMRFSLFFAAEYANVIVISAVMTVLFLGGWLRPFPNVSALSFLELVPSWIWFVTKIFVFLYLFIWIRFTLPRYRYDLRRREALVGEEAGEGALRRGAIHPHHVPNEVGQRGRLATGQEARQQRLAVVLADLRQGRLQSQQIGRGGPASEAGRLHGDH